MWDVFFYQVFTSVFMMFTSCLYEIVVSVNRNAEKLFILNALLGKARNYIALPQFFFNNINLYIPVVQKPRGIPY